jgi:Asp-tRNA(Asn)/Glu-tRNA(Gln) amidotransferase A subunit family amidase
MGSIIRPASFCGVTGFKPTFGVLSTDGVLRFAPSLDTVGLLADTLQTCRDVWSALGLETHRCGTPVFCTVEDLPPVSPEMQSTFERTISSIRTERVRLPHPYTRLLAAARTINDFEGARSHYERWCEFGDRIGERLAALVQRGMGVPQSEYEDSLGLIRDTRAPCEGQILLTPAAIGSAPEGLASTGDPVMNAVWTALGAPALTIPMQTTGLPLGLQLIAAPHADALLLANALPGWTQH